MTVLIFNWMILRQHLDGGARCLVRLTVAPDRQLYRVPRDMKFSRAELLAEARGKHDHLPRLRMDLSQAGQWQYAGGIGAVRRRGLKRRAACLFALALTCWHEPI